VAVAADRVEQRAPGVVEAVGGCGVRLELDDVAGVTPPRLR
jgi:hypothetical protein